MKIGELSRRTNLSPHVLRAWQRRYGLLEPQRSSGGSRLYSKDDERRIREMQRHMADGFPAAEAARRVSSGRLAEPLQNATGDGDARDLHRTDQIELRRAMEGLDEGAASAVIDRSFSRYTIATALDDVILPYLADLGDRWSRGESTISEEHFASFFVRSRLMSLARGWGGGTGPLALLACGPEEQHDIALLCFGLGLREHGWRIVMLGANTPVETLSATAASLTPEIVVVSVAARERLDPIRDQLQELATRHPLVIAGAGSDRDLASELGARMVSGSPMQAAAEISAAR